MGSKIACLHSGGARKGGERDSSEREGVLNQLFKEGNFFEDSLESWGGFMASSRVVVTALAVPRCCAVRGF